jgi:peptide methionine sulfoxide reductase MsrB
MRGNKQMEEQLEARCIQLAQNRQPSRPFSAQYWGRDGKPLFFYLGERIEDECPLEYHLSKEEMGKGWGNFDKQLKNRTAADLSLAKKEGKQIFYDGLAVRLPLSLPLPAPY